MLANMYNALNCNIDKIIAYHLLAVELRTGEVPKYQIMGLQAMCLPINILYKARSCEQGDISCT